MPLFPRIGRMCKVQSLGAGRPIPDRAEGRNGMSDKRDVANSDDASPPTVAERRRLAPATDLEERDRDDLAPAAGIVISVLISGLIWAILIWIV
jgi:hypothetical protein